MSDAINRRYPGTALAEDARRKKLEREIAGLESQMRKEKQPKRKFELHLAILELRDKL